MFDAVDGGGIDGSTIRVGRHRQLAIHDGLRDGIRWKLEQHFTAVHFQRPVAGHAWLHSTVVDSVGMELQVDPLVHAHRHYALRIAWARAKRQAIERVQRLFLLVRSTDVFVFLGRMEASRNQKNNRQYRPPTHVRPVMLVLSATEMGLVHRSVFAKWFSMF